MSKQFDGVTARSLKERCRRTGDGYYTLDLGNDVPLRLFLSEKLYNESEEGLYQQAHAATLYPGVAEVALTPDAHIGGSVPVGCVIATTGTLLQSPVGYDIGCGMLRLRSDIDVAKGRDERLKRKFSHEVMKRIGVGLGERGAFGASRAEFAEIVRNGASALLDDVSRENVERERLPVDDDWSPPAKAVEKGIGQLGSLGSGNHFCELQHDQDGKLWVMLHTGSRAYGYQLTAHYMRLAREEREARGEKVGGDFAFFTPDSVHWSGYRNAINSGGNFAVANRLLIARQVATAFRRVFGTEPELHYEISHNLAQEETLASGETAWVHRKGATRAFPAGHPALAGTKWADTGHPVLIPGSMGDSSYILRPLAGAANALYSVNHGCGRKYSRGEARQRFSQSGVNRQMKDLHVLVNGGGSDVPIDESPGVYKSSRDVIEAVVAANLAEVVTTLTPLAVIKDAG